MNVEAKIVSVLAKKTYNAFTLVLDRGVSATTFTGCFSPGEGSPVFIDLEITWAPELLWTFGEEKISFLMRFERWIMQPLT